MLSLILWNPWEKIPNPKTNPIAIITRIRSVQRQHVLLGQQHILTVRSDRPQPTTDTERKRERENGRREAEKKWYYRGSFPVMRYFRSGVIIGIDKKGVMNYAGRGFADLYAGIEVPLDWSTVYDRWLVRPPHWTGYAVRYIMVRWTCLRTEAGVIRSFTR